jgi:DNA ligase-associated metallophosphoesterase
MCQIEFSGHHFTLNTDGAMYWREESMLIVSDLHLEKGSHFAAKGQFLPPYDTRETLERLERCIGSTNASRILFLGDSFHDADGPDRMGLTERDMLEDICAAMQAIWVQGNHDGAWVPAHARQCEVFSLGGLTFRHEATPGGQAEISGHFHPCAEISHKGGTVRRRCFIEDGRKMILPSFGTYTGGLDVLSPVIAAHFASVFNVHVLGLEKIYSLPAERLAA